MNQTLRVNKTNERSRNHILHSIWKEYWRADNIMSNRALLSKSCDHSYEVGQQFLARPRYRALLVDCLPIRRNLLMLQVLQQRKCMERKPEVMSESWRRSRVHGNWWWVGVCQKFNSAQDDRRQRLRRLAHRINEIQWHRKLDLGEWKAADHKAVAGKWAMAKRRNWNRGGDSKKLSGWGPWTVQRFEQGCKWRIHMWVAERWVMRPRQRKRGEGINTTLSRVL